MKPIICATLLFFSASVMAQAGTVCSDKVIEAMNDCQRTITAAKGSSASSSTAKGVPLMGAAMVSGARTTSANLGAAIAHCQDQDDPNSDLGTCISQCRSAAAAATQNPEMLSTINGNLATCQRQIKSSVAEARAAQGQADSIASQATNTSNCGSDSGGDCLPVQKVGYTTQYLSNSDYSRNITQEEKSDGSMIVYSIDGNGNSTIGPNPLQLNPNGTQK